MRIFLSGLMLVFATTAVSAGTVQLLTDPGFDNFPQPCAPEADTDCWSEVDGVWVDTVGDGNDQAGGSGQPSAQCNLIGDGPEGEPSCWIGQCVNIAAYPAGTSFDYGMAHKFVVSPLFARVDVVAYPNATCFGPGLPRQQANAPGAVDTWATTSSSFVSQPGDVTVQVFLLYAPDTGAGLKTRGLTEGVVRADDGFLLVDVEDQPPPQEIPTISTLGLVLLAGLLVLTAALLRRRRGRAFASRRAG